MNETQFLTDYYKECANFLTNVDVNQSCIDAKKMILGTKKSGKKL